MEQKHESDMTPKEKRQAELEKLRGMSLGEKAGYLWTYYKIWLLIPVILIIVIWQGIQIYHNAREVELISIGIADSGLDTTTGQEAFERDLLVTLGTGEAHEVITLDTGISSGDDSASVMKRATVIGAGTMDMMICGEELYEEYESQGAFADWEEILGEDYGKYEEYFDDGRLDLSKSARWDSYGLVLYEPVYAGALAGSDKTGALRQFAEYFLSYMQ
ncbi:MAG TPA: hypothetical protein H9909_05540 [Candidatus Mediterraneibacter norfolkensis]|nr:hypothetical protein [Candidatus Mediterraneibacter norfolkensis]